MSSKEKDVVTKIQEILDTLRPYLNMDGGDVEFIKYEDKIVYVKLTGACAMCLNQGDTLNSGLLFAIQEKVKEVKEVINVDL